MSSITIDPELKPGEFVIKSLFAEFAVLAEKKIEMVMAEPLVSPQALEATVQLDHYTETNKQKQACITDILMMCKKNEIVD